MTMWEALATDALHAAMHTQWDEAFGYLETLLDEHGIEAVPWVMLAWADTTVRLCEMGPPADGRERVVVPVFLQADTGQLELVDDVPVSVRWAGRLLSARANADEETAEALMLGIDSAQQLNDNFVGVLNVCAMTLRGFAGLAD